MKEKYFLEYNKGNLATNLIQSEVHFRNLKKSNHDDVRGHANCIVKHLLDSEGEALEATSHSLIAEDATSSHKFKELAGNIREFRKRLQAGNVSADEGIREIRRLRGQFESFNPEFDVSKCQSCGNIDGFIKEFNSTNNLNTQTNNYSNDDNNMPSKSKISGKDIALMYGGQWIGLGVNAGIDSFISQYGLVAKALLAAGLPVATYFVKMPKYLAEVLILTGGYLSTKLPDYVGQYLPPATVRRATVVTTPTRVATPTGISQSKYIIT